MGKTGKTKEGSFCGREMLIKTNLKGQGRKGGGRRGIAAFVKDNEESNSR